MVDSREIITLQIGHFSNFIGSHWWNLQEASFVYDKIQKTDINHDFLFREAKSAINNESCYYPRLLIIDKKGSLGSLPRLGTAANEASLSTDQASWDGVVEVVHQLKEEKNEYLQFLDEEDNKYLQNFDEDKDICLDSSESSSNQENATKIPSFDLSDKVKVWSDFLRPHLHPDAVYCLSNLCHLEGDVGWGFQAGIETMQKEEPLEEMIDRLRKLAESCSCLQGFQLLSDGFYEMGGVSSVVGQHIYDDYGTKSLFSFISSLPNHKPGNAHDLSLYVTSLVQSYTELNKLSSVLVPLNLSDNFWKSKSNCVAFPHISYQFENFYESSSLLGCFLDTVTLPYRSLNSPLPMHHFADLLTPVQRKIAFGSLSLPLGVEDTSFLSSQLMEGEDFYFGSVSGQMDASLETVFEHRVLRGFPPNRLKSNDSNSLRKYTNAVTMYQDFLEEQDSVRRSVHGVRDPLMTTPPFPRIFNSNVNESGFLQTRKPFKKTMVKNVPAAATLTQSKGVGMYLKSVLEIATKIDVSKVPRLIEEDLDTDAWKEVLEDLSNIVLAYDLDRNSVQDSDNNSD